ncbi:MAG: SLBB domain-containing protein [Ignavibacteria bacterium]|nr:SLBB domain-containing protein [Ignavibacteria bacterium]
MTIDELYEIGQNFRKQLEGFSAEIHVCCSGGCFSTGGLALKELFEKACAARNISADVRIISTGCIGLCGAGPLVRLFPSETLYVKVQREDVERIVDEHIVGKRVLTELAYPADAPFFAKQQQIALKNMGRIDPESIDDYIAHGGYEALAKAITYYTQDGVILEVRSSGLRGRGGAGYPTGLKWSIVRKVKSTQKYVVCNADEGDPGAFMDRAMIEGNPHAILEGMAIAGYAVGATQGYVYVRGEYPLAIERLKKAIKQAERTQMLGNRIFDSDFNFRVDLRIGAGAFVCGEETALMASIEGRRGQPRPRPPYPSQSGLWGMPTLLNNVETFANIPPIILNGGKWFAGIGTEKSKGTKVFALAGRIANTGLIEVPMGMPLREIIFDIGGGIPDGGEFKAAQTGGPSGGYIPMQHLDIPVDYESLAQVGSIMGSGGLIVVDKTSCMVDLARFFMEFCMDESCGKCIPCRVGTVQLFKILDRMTTGAATVQDLHTLEELCDMVKDTSLCGLGQTAPNPVVSTLHFFRREYDEHILKHECNAGVCEMPALDEPAPVAAAVPAVPAVSAAETVPAAEAPAGKKNGGSKKKST